MKLNKLSLAVSAASLLSVSNAYAVLDIEINLITTPTKNEQTMAQNLAPIIVIDREQIEQSAAYDLTDLLKFYAGIDIAKSGGDGTPTSMFIRGTNSAHVLVIVDGVKINSASAGGAALQFLSTDMIESIELVKGPRSSLYGSEAIGGVLNISTRKNTSGLSVYGGVGSLSSSKFGFNKGFKTDDFDGTISFSQYKTEGYEDNSNSTEEHGFNNQSLQFRLGTQLAKTRLDLSHTQANGDSEYYGYNSLLFSFTELTQDNRNSSTTLTATSLINDVWSNTVVVGLASDESDQTVTPDYYHTKRHFIDIQNNFRLSPQNLLTIGFSKQKEKVASHKYNESSDVDSIYLQDDFSTGKHHIIAALRSLDDSSFGTHSTYNVDYGFAFSEQVKLGFSIGTAFKAPSLNELYFPFYGNTSIKPEESLNKEISARVQIDPKQSIKFSAFENTIDNLIAFDSATFLAGNVNKAKIEGIEVNYQLSKGNWALNANYISQDPVDTDTGDLLKRRAKETLTATVDFHHDKYTSSVNLLSTSKRNDGANDLDPYQLVSAQSAYQYNKRIRVLLKLDNVFDEEYQTAFGYPAKGRGVFLQLTYQQ